MTHAILTCSASFTDFALNELRRHHPHLTVVEQLAPQYLLLHNPKSFDHLTKPWRHRLPIYLHHLFPVHHTIALQGTLCDLDTLRKTICSIDCSDAAIQVRIDPQLDLPYADQLVHEYPLTAEPCGRVISLLITCQQSQLTAFLGTSWATQNLSPWPGGVQPHSESVPNHAGLKLIEALDTFQIRLWPNSHALDLGAAPGAWTMMLRRRDVCVTAVAPTEMYPWLKFDVGVNIYQMTAEDYLPYCKTTYDLIVNDIRMDPQDSGRLMVDFAQHLRSEGIAIMTLKLRGRNRRQVMDHTFRILRKVYKIIRVRQLVSNRSEVTLFLRRKP